MVSRSRQHPMPPQAMSLMEVTPEMQSLFHVNAELIDRTERDKRASNTELDAVDDFCDFISKVNSEANKYCEKHAKKEQEAFFAKKFRKKYVFDWQKDALNYHASVKSYVQKEREALAAQQLSDKKRLSADNKLAN